MSWSGCGGEVHHSDVDGGVKGWGGLGAMQVWVQLGGAAVLLHSLLGVLRDGVGRV